MNEEVSKNKIAFASISALRKRIKDGTFHEVIEDWKWIFTYSARYKAAIAFFVILHYDWVMALIALGSAPFMLLASKFILTKQRKYSRKVKEMNSSLMSFEVETFYNFDTI